MPKVRAEHYDLGVDVGSTTVKVALLPKDSHHAIYRSYLRHEARQAQTVLSELRKVEREFGLARDNTTLFMTGSGGAGLANILRAKFVQEVTAVSLAVEALYPAARSVIELGGQDSKIIIFQDSQPGWMRRKFTSMNDKCAGGTGAIIEKIAAKLGIDSEKLGTVQYDGVELHPVAGKCGVFAETDINGLQKQGVPPEQLMASLFDAIVLQNLSVLTRGQQLKAQVLLLGGPNYFLPGLRQAWAHQLRRLWKAQNIVAPAELSEEECIQLPPDATLLGAIGAIEYGRSQNEDEPYSGSGVLEAALASREWSNRDQAQSKDSRTQEVQRFLAKYSTQRKPVSPSTRDCEQVFLGIDGGSTTTKAVCLSCSGEVVASSYAISKADPVSDVLGVLKEIGRQFEAMGIVPRVLGAATTGYSRTLLRKVLRADCEVVETVAHAKSAVHFHHDVDAIIDVGGQDIKIIQLQNGNVKDFRINTQCSAGNGYFLQAAAESLGLSLNDFAPTAFSANRAPIFSYGCAVFLQSEIVNFQRQGWLAEEILAGLAEVLPKNVFLYVAGLSNVAKLGRRLLLQGGTQRNLAVVKAEIDFVEAHYFGEGRPEVFVHPYCGEAGAIGAALHSMEVAGEGRSSSFVGFHALDEISHSSKRSEATRCSFCANRCLRTFIDVGDTGLVKQRPAERIILANCERGTLPDCGAASEFNRSLKEVQEANPNIPAIAARRCFELPALTPGFGKTSPAATVCGSGQEAFRGSLRIGIPRVLNFYGYAPFFTAYFQSIGIKPENIVFSGVTSPEMYKRAMGLAAIDPCFPSKVCIAHVYDLVQKSKARPLDCIFFPMMDVLLSPLEGCVGASTCPAGAATPAAVKAAFTIRRNLFQECGTVFLDPMIDFSNRELLAMQMFESCRSALRLKWKENLDAVAVAYKALAKFESTMRSRSLDVLERLEIEDRIGLVLLGRPYHHDPGMNQGILDAFQQLGYPVLSQSYLPLDDDILERLFGDEVRAGIISSPLSIKDVWKNSNSVSTNNKFWAAKFAARHPNLIPIELSNFKCGHDAFVSRVIKQVIECAGKPHFCFGDLDENKPSASLQLRVETIHYFLQQYQRALRQPRAVPPTLLTRTRGAGESHTAEIWSPPGCGPSQKAVASAPALASTT